MSIRLISPKKAVNSAFLKIPVSVENMERFSVALVNLHKKRNAAQDEEYHKNEIQAFLKKIFDPDYSVQVKRPIDLAIFNGNDTAAKPAVIIEAKSPTNTAEMFSEEKPNVKSLQELVYYFMLEYIRFENREIKYLAITNFDEWYFFDVKDFVRYFASKSNPVYAQFQKFEANQMSGNKTSDFYNDIAKPAIDDFLKTCDINVVHFNLGKMANLVCHDAKQNVIASKAKQSNVETAGDVIPAPEPESSLKMLRALYKFFSPETLLAKPFANDSNTLDRNFYAELLHIIGLEEVKDGGKKVISRKKPANRDKASLLESAIYQLEMDIPDENKCETMALRLCITWVNRLLFLKLVESQILMYQKGDAAYRFMSLDKIANFDELNIFFFKVLGKKIEARDKDVLERYPNVPYLNSSLFEPTEDEDKLKIRGIPDAPIEIFNKTVLKDERGKRAKGTMHNLEYIFKFLDAYDFASDAQGGVTSTSKTLINASVLGLIFEKINGYKDGSFFTPGFITDYMARDVLERTVVQKFNETKNWACQNLDEVKEKIDDVDDANKIVDDVRIADVAVGSGHFLVSALNRMLAIKSQLNIFRDVHGKRIKRMDLELKVDNDELSVVDDEGEPFEYKPGNPERQRIQEALFHEKKNIIENCLFGVDLNPNSVNICRLRLWIELLKNAYYTEESGYTRLETLPNIDINIKVGDSLLSKYPVQNGHMIADYLSAEEKGDRKKDSLKTSLVEYRNYVKEYKAGGTQNSKMMLRQKIASLKSRMVEDGTLEMFEEYANKADGTIDFSNSLEWMFEFPEILDDQGRFVGFDAVIGNPPYIQLQSMGEMSDVYGKRGYGCYNKSADIYCLFVERAHSLLKKNGHFSFIMPNKWMLVDYGKELRRFMGSVSLKKILNFGDIQFFDDATIYVCIFVAQKSGEKSPVLACSLNSKNYNGEFEKEVKAATFEFPAESFGESEWSIRNKLHDSVLQKMQVGTPLKEMPISIYRGILTGFNDAFFIDGKTREKLIVEDPKSAELIKPLLRGRDIEAWETEAKEQYLIGTFPSLKLNIDDYPAIKNHLLQFGMERLEQTGVEHIINGEKVKARKKTSNKWFETQDQIGYYKEFAKPKIVYPNMTSAFPFTYDEIGSLCNDKAFIITENTNVIPASEPESTNNVIANPEGVKQSILKSLLAILNSNLAKLWIWYNCPELMGGTREIRKVYFENFRIPLNNPELLQQLADLADEIIEAKKNGEETTELEKRVNEIVYQLYGVTDAEEIEAVEKR